MNKKIPLGICISLVVLACVVTFVLTMTVSLEKYNQKISGFGQREEIYSKLQEIDEYVRGNYYGTIDNNQLLTKILDGYAQGVGDAYTKYFTADEYYQELQHQQGKIVTPGIEVEREESGYIKVAKIYEGSSAKIQGVAIGDVITVIDNSAVLDIGADKAIKMINGDVGSRLNIKIQRNGIEKQFVLSRQLVEVISAKGSVYNNYGFIKITDFTELTAGQFLKITNDMLRKNIKGFVFDLRGTSGDLVQPVSDMLNRILSAAVVASAEYGDGRVAVMIETDNDKSVNLPVVILTDGGTSGMGELFAAALRDFCSAQIVGTTTKGKAVIQQIHALRDGSAIKISYAKIASLGITKFDEIGIIPDFIVERTPNVETDVDFSNSDNLSNLVEGTDVQMKKAYEVIEVLTE